MVGYAVSHQNHAPQPSAAAAGRQLDASPPAAQRAPGLAASRPTSIQIPALGVSSAVNVVGLNPDHTMQVPQPGPRYDQPAWYRYSPTPGEIGPSVIMGHVDSAAHGPSVFFNLGRLVPGQRIRVSRDDQSTVTFDIDSVVSYPKDSFPVDAVYGNTDYPALRLITCGGSFDHTTHQYRNNIVVFAHLVSRN
ncbi:MAG: class F sortase [Pseudonocardiaceae bacterium]